MKILGIILTGLIIGFVTAMPLLDTIRYAMKGTLGIIAGITFYAAWSLFFPTKWKDNINTGRVDG